MKDDIGELTFKIMEDYSIRKAELIESFIEETMPKWWVWCVKKGGILRFVASKIVRIYIVEKRS